MSELSTGGMSQLPMKAAPYISFTSMKSFLAGLGNGGGVPIVIDNSVLSGMSGGYRGQMKTALRFLEFIDKDNRPTALMRQGVAAVADAEQWKAFVRGLLEKHYAVILQHPLTETTQSALRKEFETTFGGNADLITKSITFFLHAAREAGIALSPRLTERQKGGGKRAPRRRSPEVTAGVAAETPPSPIVPSSAPKARKVSEHQMALIEIVNTYTDMDDAMRKALLEVVGFIATKGVTV